MVAGGVASDWQATPGPVMGPLSDASHKGNSPPGVALLHEPPKGVVL